MSFDSSYETTLYDMIDKRYQTTARFVRLGQVQDDTQSYSNGQEEEGMKFATKRETHKDDSQLS